MTTTKTPRAAKSTKTKVFLVDDHPILRHGIKERINMEDDLTVCGEAETGLQALQLISAQKPDLAIVDISLKGNSGIELMKDIKVRFPRLPVLMLSMHDESLYADRSLRAGARGYIMKQEQPEALMRAIRRVLAGDIYVSESIKNRMVHMVAGRNVAQTSPMERLSDRELEVFQLISQGHGTREIAQKLHLSIKTVAAYRENIKQKLNLKSGSELLRHAFHWARNQGLS